MTAKPETIPPELWARMEALWEREFESQENVKEPQEVKREVEQPLVQEKSEIAAPVALAQCPMLPDNELLDLVLSEHFAAVEIPPALESGMRARLFALLAHANDYAICKAFFR